MKNEEIFSMTGVGEVNDHWLKIILEGLRSKNVQDFSKTDK